MPRSFSRLLVVTILAAVTGLAVGAAPAAAQSDTGGLKHKRTTGGANQRVSLEGCMNEWLFNGIWRFRVLSVDPITNDAQNPGWGVSVEMRNGAPYTFSPAYSGVDFTDHGLQLGFADGSFLGGGTTTLATLNLQKLAYKDMPQGAGMRHQLQFFYPDGTKADQVQRPVKLLLAVDRTTRMQHTDQPQYTTKNPSFRVKLDCNKPSRSATGK